MTRIAHTTYKINAPEKVLQLMAQFNVDENSDSSKCVRLSDAVHNALEDYFTNMDGNNHECEGLYQMVLGEVERPLLTCVMYHCKGNRTLAAKVLGITRTTLRKKLELYQIEA